jgi:hypothetical protein
MKFLVHGRLHMGSLLCLMILLLSVTDLFGGTVTLSWKPPETNTDGSTITDLAGYKVYYGTVSGDYSNTIDVGNVTMYQISSLTNGLTYYFAVTSYNTSGNESVYSNEISKLILDASSIAYSITAYTSGSGTITPGGVSSVSKGGTQTYTITANPGYYISAVAVDGVYMGSITNYTFSNVTGNHTIMAYFRIVTFAIAASAGTGGSISPSGSVTVANGDSLTFAIIPDAGYHIESVLVDGAPVGAATSYMFSNVTASHTISATFAADLPYTISVSEGKAGELFGTGADGAITISSSVNINTATLAAGRSCADGGDGVAYNVLHLSDDDNFAMLDTWPSSGCLAAGDKVMLINLQGSSGNYDNAGNYEILTVNFVSTDMVYFTTPKTKCYGFYTGSPPCGGEGGSYIGITTNKQRVILQRVPQYTDVTIQSGGLLTASSWDGSKGGVLAFYVTGTTTVSSGGSITMSAKGYRSQIVSDVSQGESFNKLGDSAYAIANLGGGGADYWCDPAGGCDYYREDVFGGGGYRTAGTNAVGNYVTAFGGETYGDSNLTKLFMGSSGGSDNSDINGGGGIILIGSNNLTVSGSVSNDGISSMNCVHVAAGGAGGSTYLSGSTLNVDMDLVTAQGGAGGSCPGIIFGAGGAGRIHLNYVVPN